MMHFKFIASRSKSMRRVLKVAAIGFFSGLAAVLPARSAEKIYFDYGPLSRSLSVSSLESFAKDGTVDSELAQYLRFIPEARWQRFQKVLGTPLSDLNSNIPEQVKDPFILSQWLYDPMGELVLEGIGQMVRTQGHLNGKKAIRAAMLLAATDSEGLSLINFIRAYPTSELRIDLQEVLSLYRDIKANIKTTEQLNSAVIQVSETTAAAEPKIDYKALPVLAGNGPLAIQQRTLVLNDATRDRSYPVDLYQPADLSAVQGPIPVVVMSHGYGDTRKNPQFVRAAQNFAAYGFVVAVVEHVGSNYAYQQDLNRGLNKDSFDAMEFVNRPLDIRFLLDTLEQRNAAEFQGRLQLSRVGLLGHSFGGYTMLAVAGATVDLDYLRRTCVVGERATPDKVDIALLLQCRALELGEFPAAMQRLTDGSLADDRVGMVMALAPVTKLFSKASLSQLQIPVVLLGGEFDIASPVALEQLKTFQALTTPERYLYLGEKMSHTPRLTQIALRVTNPNEDLTDKDLEETQSLFSNLIVSLFMAHSKVYLGGDESYRPYLTASYVRANSVEPLKLHLVRSILEGF